MTVTGQGGAGGLGKVASSAAYGIVGGLLGRAVGLVEEAHRRGEIVLAGALADPVDRALLIFRVADKRIVEEFARNDPYVTGGLVTRWEVRPWTVVAGGEEGGP